MPKARKLPVNDYITINQIVRIARRRWWILVATILVTVLAAYVISAQQPRIYRATTSMIVGPTITGSNPNRDDLQISQQLARIYADIAQRQRVLRAVVQTLELDQSWRALRDQVRVEPVESTQLLEIQVDARSPEQAVAIADELARQLIELGPNPSGDETVNEVEQFVQERMARLQQNITEGQLRIDTLDGYLAQLVERGTAPDQLQTLQAEIQSLEGLMATWEATYAGLYQTFQSKTPSSSLTVFEPAEALTDPIRPRTNLNLLIAAILGFGIGVALIAALETVDDSLRSADEVSDLLRLASFGAITRMPGKRADDLLIANQDVFSSMAEDARLLRSKLLALSQEWPRKVFLITSPAQGEGKSLLVANLGTAMANIGLRTAIVDANLRNPAQHTLFHLPQADGLTEEIHSSRSELTRRVKASQIENLYVLTSGSPALASPDRLATARMSQLFDRLAEQMDIILCDAPEAVGISDTLVLASQANGVLLVIDAGQTARETARQAVFNLRQSSANLLGFVLNRVPTEARAASVTVRRRRPARLVEPVIDEPSPSKL